MLLDVWHKFIIINLCQTSDGNFLIDGAVHTLYLGTTKAAHDPQVKLNEENLNFIHTTNI